MIYLTVKETRALRNALSQWCEDCADDKAEIATVEAGWRKIVKQMTGGKK